MALNGRKRWSTHRSLGDQKVHVDDVKDVKLDLVLVLDQVDVVRSDVAFAAERLDGPDDAHVDVRPVGRGEYQS